jgi:hypothetical protein
MTASPAHSPAAAAPSRLAPRWTGLAFAALFAAALIWGAELSTQLLGHLNAHGHKQLHVHGHPFADARAWLFVPNAADTLSNLAFALLALWGLRRQQRHGGTLPGATRGALAVLWLGLLLTALGSGLYHWQPSPQRLVADRLGMAVAFAGVLALASSGMRGPRAGWATLALMLPAASVAAALPLQGNVLPWMVVQGGGVLWLLLAACSRAQPEALVVRWGWVVAGYAIAKVFESGDAAVFAATGQLVSGHTLKHLVAAAALWPVLAALAPRARQALA